MNIRKAETEDIPAIAVLARQMIDQHHQLDPYFRHSAGYDDLESDLEKELKDRNGLFLVAEDAAKIVGYFRGSADPAPGYVQPKKIGTVYDLVVAEKKRHQNIGTRLFAEALDWFRAKKIKNIELNVAALNQAGLAFWRKFGFSDYKIRMRLDLEK